MCFTVKQPEDVRESQRYDRRDMMGIKSFVSRLRGKAQDDGPGWNIFFGLSEPWKPASGVWDRFSDEEKEKIYKLSDIIFACVREISTTISEPFLEIGSFAEDGFQKLEKHPKLDLVYDPNPIYDYNMNLFYLMSRMLLTGETNSLKLRNGLNDIGEMWPIPTHRIRLKSGKGNNLIDHYELTDRGKAPVPIPANDVMHIFLPDPASVIRSAAPLDACIHRYQIDKEAEDYMIEMITNMKVPSVKIMTEKGKTLTQPHRDDLRASLHDHSGKGSRGGAVVLDGGVTAEAWVPLKDLDWPGLFMMDETRICACFGVPPILIGLRSGLEHATYANYAEARKSFYMETMRPLWIALQSALTKSMLTNEGEPNLEFRFNLEEVAGLQEDAKQKSERASRGIQSGYMTVNDARKLDSLEPDPNGDVYLRSPLLQEVPVDPNDREDPEPPPETSPPVEGEE